MIVYCGSSYVLHKYIYVHIEYNEKSALNFSFLLLLDINGMIV